MSAAPKPFRVQSEALTQSARGKNCTVRSLACNGDPETTVLAHLRGPWALGIGTKPHDFFCVYACSACHDALDGRNWESRVQDYDRLHALYETQSIMFLEGLIQIKGAK